MSRPWNRPQFDLVELVAVAFFVGMCASGIGVWYVGLGNVPAPLGYSEATTLREVGRLRDTYGPGHYSFDEEEWIIRDFFRDRREGFFVDVGAGHYQRGSNTFYLETRLGWSGIAIDPQAGYEADYRKYRSRTRFFPLFVSDVSDETAKLYMSDQLQFSTGASGSLDFARLIGGNVVGTAVRTVTLTDLLTHLQVGRIDLLSIDVELWETKVLAGFDIDHFKPALVCIEAHRDIRQQILDYFAKHAYVAVGRYLGVDVRNLYFTPVEPDR